MLAEALSGRGYAVWWDRTIPPGKVFDEVIEQALTNARCVIVLWSRDSAASNWVKTEAAEASGRNLLVPVLIENVPVPIEFKRIQVANLSSWEGDQHDSEFVSLLTSIERLLNGPRGKLYATAPRTCPHDRLPPLRNRSVPLRASGKPTEPSDMPSE